MRYPISVQTFEKIINGGYVYADKTDLVYELAQNNICFLSRPRRFGKSLLISTLEAYFSGRKDLFKGLKIDSLEDKWEQYPIFRIDFADGNYTEPEELEKKLNSLIGKWEREYGADELCQTLSDRFQYVIKEAEKKTGHKVVVLIDEYDKPMLDVLGTDIEENTEI